MDGSNIDMNACIENISKGYHYLVEIISIIESNRINAIAKAISEVNKLQTYVMFTGDDDKLIRKNDILEILYGMLIEVNDELIERDKINVSSD